MTSRPLLPPDRGDRASGFTLVEVMISMVILGIIVGVVATMFTVLTRTSQQAQARLNQSRGPKFASVYWTPDVASSESVNPTGIRCGTAGSPLVTFQWTDDRLAQPQVATWATVTGVTGTDLVRTQCDANALAVPRRSTLVAPDLAASGVQVRCDGGGGLVACASPTAPSRVVLDVATHDGRAFTIDANREVS